MHRSVPAACLHGGRMITPVVSRLRLKIEQHSKGSLNHHAATQRDGPLPEPDVCLQKQHMAECDGSITAAASLLASMARDEIANCLVILRKPDSISLLLQLLRCSDAVAVACGCQLAGAICQPSTKAANMLLGKGMPELLSHALEQPDKHVLGSPHSEVHSMRTACAARAVADIAKNGELAQVTISSTLPCCYLCLQAHAYIQLGANVVCTMLFQSLGF